MSISTLEMLILLGGLDAAMAVTAGVSEALGKSKDLFTQLDSQMIHGRETKYFRHLKVGGQWLAQLVRSLPSDHKVPSSRSEERRVGKECRSRWSPYH